MRLTEIENKKGGYGYVQANVSQDSQNAIGTLSQDCDVPEPLPGYKLHATLIYDDSNPLKKSAEEIEHIKSDKTLTGTVTHADYLGEGKWGALVLHLDSPDLEKRHQELLDMGFTSSYPEYLPHVSLNYGQDQEEDVKDRVNEYLKKNQLKLEFNGEYWASTHD